MFTPPASPLPSPTKEAKVELISGTTTTVAADSQSQKRQTGRRTRWTVLTVPLVLVLITLSTRFIDHPVALDLLDGKLWSHSTSQVSPFELHPRHIEARQAATEIETVTNERTHTSTVSAPTATLAGTAQPLPSVPSSPPVLPTPFPQPFDETMSYTNFSSVTCLNFFTNMTATSPFRACRPFSLLMQHSAEFLLAQDNLTAMNSIVWGSCNANIAQSQCASNMSWFATELEEACALDLSAGNVQAQTTLQALQAYEVMQEAACLVEPSTNTYCYVNAVHNTNPADLYYYMLPLGSPLPNSARSSCIACTKNLMSIYSAALTSGAVISGLQKTYDDAAQQAVTDCGASYALATSSANNLAVFRLSTGLMLAFSLVLAGALS